ncbi:MAG: AgrD family cyclic lactone autoinducer peptide [Sarcina sp.]
MINKFIDKSLDSLKMLAEKTAENGIEKCSFFLTYESEFPSELKNFDISEDEIGIKL